jgi:hypothetical protein
MGFIARRIAKRSQQYKNVDEYLKELWRPLMAWVYAIVVLFDFMIAPILLGIYCAVFKQPYIEWKSLTIQGGGMFHIAMGAVIGVSSYGHSQEKINGAVDNGTVPSMPAWTPPIPPTVAAYNNNPPGNTMGTYPLPPTVAAYNNNPPGNTMGTYPPGTAVTPSSAPMPVQPEPDLPSNTDVVSKPIPKAKKIS